MKAYLLLTVSALSLTIAATSAHAARDPIIGSSSDSVSVYKSADSTLKARFGGSSDRTDKEYSRTEPSTEPPGDGDGDTDPDPCEHEGWGNKGGWGNKDSDNDEGSDEGAE